MIAVRRKRPRTAGSLRLEEWWTTEPRSVPFWRRLNGPRLFVLSFALLVAGGTLGLLLLPGIYTGEDLSLLDALFTATSAVCVTGLIVVDTATYFTTVGQAFILLLIQLGGLGIITFTTLIIVALGRSLTLNHESVVSAGAQVVPNLRFDTLTYDVIRFTLAIEAIGAVMLYLSWGPVHGWGEAAWPALFHSVSAFCNAGFSTFSSSLIESQRSPFTLSVVMALIVAGGLGFLTMTELKLVWQSRRIAGRGYLVSLHSRLALVTTAVLIVGGWVGFAVFEWHRTLNELPIFSRLVNALFQSVTARTAGFNSIDYSVAADSTNFLTILLMFIGGSPGSTAGGLKTTTLAVLAVLAWSRLRGRRAPSVLGRSITEETIDRTVGLVVVTAAVVTVSILLLTMTEASGAADRGRTFLAVVFEAASAFNTVGLTMGLTPELSGPGKGVAIVLMFFGRVGTLTLTAALAASAWREPRGFRYAYEDIVVG